MTSRFRKVITGVALVAVLALGGAGVANALSSDSGEPSSATAAADAAAGTADQRATETPSAGDAPADGRDCPEGSGGRDGTQDGTQDGEQGGTTEDADV